MTKKIMKLNEILDGKVEFISLVKRGANRIPFRVLKQLKDGVTLDLANLEPVSKGGIDLECSKDLGSKVMEGDALVPSSPSETAVDKAVSAFREFITALMYGVSGDMSEQMDHSMKEETTKMAVAQDPNNVVPPVAEQDPNAPIAKPVEAAAPVQAAPVDPALHAAAASAHANAATAHANAVHASVAMPGPAAPAVEPAKEEPKMEETTVADDETVEKPAEAAAPAAEADELNPDGTKKVKPVPAAKSDEGDSVEKIAKAVAEAVQKTVGERMQTLETALSSLSQKLERVETVAKSAEKALNGTVNGSDQDERTSVRKQEQSSRVFGVIDTGYRKI